MQSRKNSMWDSFLPVKRPRLGEHDGKENWAANGVSYSSTQSMQMHMHQLFERQQQVEAEKNFQRFLLQTETANSIVTNERAQGLK